MSLSNVSLVDLTVWSNERCEEAGEYAESLREEVARRGGPAPANEVKEWLAKRLAIRETNARDAPRYAHLEDVPFLRVEPCPCGARTQQLLHGFTATGRLWKGHVCECGGWQCSECGRILNRRSMCCR